MFSMLVFWMGGAGAVSTTYTHPEVLVATVVSMNTINTGESQGVENTVLAIE